MVQWAVEDGVEFFGKVGNGIIKCLGYRGLSDIFRNVGGNIFQNGAYEVNFVAYMLGGEVKFYSIW